MNKLNLNELNGDYGYKFMQNGRKKNEKALLNFSAGPIQLIERRQLG